MPQTLLIRIRHRFSDAASGRIDDVPNVVVSYQGIASAMPLLAHTESPLQGLARFAVGWNHRYFPAACFVAARL